MAAPLPGPPSFSPTLAGIDPMKATSSLFIILSVSALVHAQTRVKGKSTSDLPEYHGPKKRAIVTGMDVKVSGLATTATAPSGGMVSLVVDLPSPTDFGTGLADILLSEMNATKRFVMLERLNFDDILKEQQLSNSPEANTATSIKAGQILGAQVIIRGALVEFSYKKEMGSASAGIVGEQMGIGKTTYTATVGIELKMVDVATGRILDSIHAQGSITNHADTIQVNAFGLQIGKTTFDTSPMGKAVRAAIKNGVKQICERTEAIPWQATIAALDDEDGKSVIYLNVGKDSGLAPDMMLDVFHLGKPIIDPDTQVQIGRTKDIKLGSVKVVSLEGKLTKVVSSNGGPFVVGDVVRIPSSTQ